MLVLSNVFTALRMVPVIGVNLRTSIYFTTMNSLTVGCPAGFQCSLLLHDGFSLISPVINFPQQPNGTNLPYLLAVKYSSKAYCCHAN